MPSKQVLSPAQALLLLLDKYKNDETISSQLKKLYLLGVQNDQNLKILEEYFQDPLFASYEISYDKNIINDDPTRRYFETHLAYQTLLRGLEQLDGASLSNFVNRVENMLTEKSKAKYQQILEGDFEAIKKNYTYEEYARYIIKIREKHIFKDLSPDDREKLILLVKSALLCTMSAIDNHHSLPLKNTYSSGLYAEENKGRIHKWDPQKKIRSNHLGLMKGHMPLPLDDNATNEENDKRIEQQVKASALSTFKEGALWVETSFKGLVHPFSNAISGTTLTVLKHLSDLNKDKKAKGENLIANSSESLPQFCRLYISAMLYSSGGHSLFEYTYPFQLEEVKKEFQGVRDFSSISLESLFLTNNAEAFDQALSSAIDYNKKIIQKKTLHAELQKVRSPLLSNTNDYVRITEYKQELKSKNIAQTIQALKDIKKEYRENVSKQLFSSYRAGSDKSQLISQKIDMIIQRLENGAIDPSLWQAKFLQDNLKDKYGDNNIFGRKSRSYETARKIQDDLLKLKDTIKTIEEQDINLEHITQNDGQKSRCKSIITKGN